MLHVKLHVHIKYLQLFWKCCELLDRMDWEASGRKEVCPVGRHSPTNCLEKMKRTTNKRIGNLDDWLTMHRSITLVDLQRDA
jgi:hypothetical protein